MLRWSSHATNEHVDLAAVAAGAGDVGLEHGPLLLAFASACAGTDDGEIARARAALVDATDEAFMVDAAAVAANFEMMTRLADGTGASMPPDVVEQRAGVIGVMGVADLVSRR